MFDIRSRLFSLTLACLAGSLLVFSLSSAVACPFCNAVSQTLRQEMSAMDAVVIATAVQDDQSRDKETGEAKMKVEKVLKGADLVSEGQQIDAIYYGTAEKGSRFMIRGVDPPEMQWSCLPISERAESYIVSITRLPDDDLARLQFFYRYLQDKESMLARDAYDEFAIAPYDAVQQLRPEMNHDQLVKWIQDPEMPTDRKRLYLTLLGVCGTEKDVPMLEEMLRSTQKSTRGGLDALIACYLTLAGEDGLELVNELFLNNKQAPYADTYAAIMAVRFHGTEGEIIPRSALVESLHHVLDREDLADLVIPDLARWNDWSQIDRLTKLFVEADPDNNWVRVPVVNYLRACPLPEADKALEKLKEVDPESVRRANTFFSIPVPTRDTGSTQSSTDDAAGFEDLAALPPREVHSRSAGPTASTTTDKAIALSAGPMANLKAATANRKSASAAAPVAAISPAAASMNPFRLAYVLVLALSTIMIAQFLLLSGGAQPTLAEVNSAEPNS